MKQHANCESNETKVLVLGLDGATWKVLNPLIKAGLLPRLERLVRNGASGILISTIPPVTSPAWPAMATGLNPGKLGVYGTLRRSRSNVFTLKPVTSSVYRGKAIWDRLSKHGLHVALFKIPFLHPVYKINGCMVSGFGSASKFATYPSRLHKKFMRGPSSLLEAQLFRALPTLNLNNQEECTKYIGQLKMIVQEERDLIIESARSIPWDLLFYVISPTDWLQHAFMDRIIKLPKKVNSNSDKTPELETTDRALIDFYKSIDHLIGQFLKLVERKSNDFAFFIVSDHGFTIRPYTFNLAKWLINHRYMTLRTLRQQRQCQQRLISLLARKVADLSKSSMLGRIVEHILKSLPSDTLQALKRTYFNATSKTTISRYIDFTKSKVFCLEDRRIYLNHSARNTQVLDEMIYSLNEHLSHFPHLELKTFKPGETYWGNKVQLAPDLIIKISDNNRVWEISTDPAKPLIFKPHLPGIHDSYGIFVAYGPKIIKNVSLDRTMIWDVCPTILHLFGVQPSPNIDGKVMKQIFAKK